MTRPPTPPCKRCRYSKGKSEKELQLQRKGRRWLLCAGGAIAAYVFLSGQVRRRQQGAGSRQPALQGLRRRQRSGLALQPVCLHPAAVQYIQFDLFDMVDFEEDEDE